MTNFAPTCFCSRPTSKIKLRIATDASRSAFVDRVCGLLIESRFGPGAGYDQIVELNGPLETSITVDNVPDEFFDLTGRPQSVDMLGEFGVDTTRPVEIIPSFGVSPSLTEALLTPSTLPRGSPAQA